MATGRRAGCDNLSAASMVDNPHYLHIIRDWRFTAQSCRMFFPVVTNMRLRSTPHRERSPTGEIFQGPRETEFRRVEVRPTRLSLTRHSPHTAHPLCDRP